jgi:hypothetical protein
MSLPIRRPPRAVVVAATSWDEIPRMRHQVTRQLLRWFDVLYVEFFPRQAATTGGGAIRTPSDGLQVYRPVPPFRVRPRLYAVLPWVQGYVNRWFRDDIMTRVREGGPEMPVLFTFLYHFPEIVRATPFSRKYYLCCDEFPRMWRSASRPREPTYSLRSWLYQRYEDSVARHSDRCLASHTRLVEKLRKANPRTRLFLHGHEFSEGPRLRRRRASGERIRVGFMGFITYNLVLSWLRAVTNAPDMELFLIGPIQEFDPSCLAGGAAVLHLGALQGRELLEALVGMDVLIMPYRPEVPEVNVQTASNKFFQYVAAGRPVVISNMPHYLDMPEGVLYRARTAEQFLEKIRQADREDREEFVRQRLDIARGNTWEIRGETLHAMLEEDLGCPLPQVRDWVGPE